MGTQAQNQLLAAINRAGLSLEQMETIQSALHPLLAARDAVVSAQQALGASHGARMWLARAEWVSQVLSEKMAALRGQ